MADGGLIRGDIMEIKIALTDPLQENVDSSRLVFSFSSALFSCLILFLIYVNDAQFISRLIHLVLYADDMNILVSHKNINTLVFTMQKELQINVIKTSCILFSSGQKRFVQ